MFIFVQNLTDWLDFLQRSLLVHQLFLAVFGTTRSLVEGRGRGKVLILVEVAVVVRREVAALQGIELVHGVRARLKKRKYLVRDKAGLCYVNVST